MAKRLGRPPGLTPDGPKIKRLRVGLGWTVPQLAAQIGRHPESVRRAEGGRPIGDVFASRLARALGVTMRDITDYDEDESEPETPDRLSA
jgi:transcriptional regulator with XRE-family HTH domain